MAIKNENGNYLKIKSIDDNDLSRAAQIITWELWKDESTRTSPSGFDKATEGHTILSNLQEKLDTNADSNQSIKNNKIIAAYTALKETEAYSDWIDC